MSLYLLPPCHMSLSLMLHVEFRISHVALVIVRVKGHSPSELKNIIFIVMSKNEYVKNIP